MKNFLSKALFFYSAIASLIITVSLVLTSDTLAPVIFAVLFLPVTAYFIVEFFKQTRTALLQPKDKKAENQSKPKKGNIILIVLSFLLLLGIGIRNIHNSNNTPIQVSESPLPSSSPFVFKVERTASPTATLKVVITDNSPSVNIRQKPTTYSEKVGTANDGDVFEFTDISSGWYKIDLASGSGYISARYIEEIKE